MSAKNKLDALKAAFEKKGTSTQSSNQQWKLFFPFWKAPTDSTTTIRFLPDLDEDNTLGFLVENMQHELHVNGKRENVACLQMFGESCPICDLSRKCYDEGDEDTGKKYYRKKSYIGQVIVIESPIEHDQTQLVKLIDFGPAVFKQIQSAFQSGDLEEAPYELKGGYNFRIKKTTSGQYASYNTSSFAPKQTDLDDELIASLNLFNLADYRTERLPRETVEAMLVADQTGSSVNTSQSNQAAPVATATPVVQAVTKPTVVEDTVAPPAETAAPTNKTGAILDQLRARAKAAAASA